MSEWSRNRSHAFWAHKTPLKALLIPFFIFFQDYPKLSQSYYSLLEVLTQDHMNFIASLEPHVIMYILSSISEGLTALGECSNRYWEV